jgi:hypothetical protein
MTRKDDLIQKIKALGFPESEVVVSVEDFFEGNEDYGSIGCNIYPNQPSPADFYKKFKELKQNKSVGDILIRIVDIEDGDWPFTDAVYIISNLNVEQIKELVKDLTPDEVYEDWMYKKPINAPEIKPDMKVFSIWWD